MYYKVYLLILDLTILDNDFIRSWFYKFNELAFFDFWFNNLFRGPPYI